MKRNVRSRYIAAIWVLSVLLATLIGVAVMLSARAEHLYLPPASSLQASYTDAPSTHATPPTTGEAAASIPNTTEAPTETTVPIPSTTETPAQEQHFTLTFVGDCTFGVLLNSTAYPNFSVTVGENYDYPLEKVRSYFENDECTFLNLEGPLCKGGTPQDKRYIHKGIPEYTQIMTGSSVEFANVVNNHSFDMGKQGYQETLTALDEAGLLYAEQNSTCLFTTKSGLVIGVYSAQFPSDTNRIRTGIQKLEQQGAKVIIFCVHWGTEYQYKAPDTNKALAHAAIDAGADIVYGHHPHVLQPVEQYKDGIIYYSLGNFSYGGNRNPPDKDTAILQQEIIKAPDGSVSLGTLTMIPCHVTGLLNYGNDFQPVPMEEDTTAYNRTLQKLNGTYPKDFLYVSYRDDLYPTETTEVTTVPATEFTEPAEETTAPTTSATVSTEETNATDPTIF